MNDFLLDDDFDLDFKNGDFSFGESAEQHVKLILTYSPGQLKAYLLTGAGIIKSKNGTITRFAKNNIRRQLISDGFKIKKLSILTSGILIDGKY